MLCGGRENLFSLLDTCWIYTWSKDTWHLGDSLPEPVAGAATVCQDDRMMLIGGVVEEDYYQDTEHGDYYDYNMEVATSKEGLCTLKVLRKLSQKLLVKIIPYQYWRP